MKPLLILATLLILAPTVQAQNLTAEDRAFITDHMAGVLNRLVQVEQATLTVLERLEAIEAQNTASEAQTTATLAQVEALTKEARTATDQVQLIQDDVAALSLLPDQVADASTGIKAYIRETMDLSPIQQDVQAQDEAIRALEAKTATLTNVNLLLAALVAAMVGLEAHRRWNTREPKAPKQAQPGNDEDDEEDAIQASLALKETRLEIGWDAPAAPVVSDPGPGTNGMLHKNGMTAAKHETPSLNGFESEALPEADALEPAPPEPIVTVKAPPDTMVGVCGACFTDSGPCQSEGHCMLGVHA